GGMLPVTPSAHARACEGAGRLDPVRGGGQDLHGICPQEAARPLGDLHPHAFTGQCVSYEHHLVLVTSHAPSPVRDVVDGHLEFGAHTGHLAILGCSERPSGDPRSRSHQPLPTYRPPRVFELPPGKSAQLRGPPPRTSAMCATV